MTEECLRITSHFSMQSLCISRGVKTAVCGSKEEYHLFRRTLLDPCREIIFTDLLQIERSIICGQPYLTPVTSGPRSNTAMLLRHAHEIINTRLISSKLGRIAYPNTHDSIFQGRKRSKQSLSRRKE